MDNLAVSLLMTSTWRILYRQRHDDLGSKYSFL